MYVTDAAQSSTDVEALRKAMRDSEGLGSFKHLFFCALNGKADGIKIVPLSEVATKEDFFNIKKVSTAGLLDAHRIPLHLMGGSLKTLAQWATSRRWQRSLYAMSFYRFKIEYMK